MPLPAPSFSASFSFSALLLSSLTRAWLVLLGITVATYWMGESGLQGRGSALPVLAMFALTFVKGWIVSLDFLALRHAPPLWRWLVVGWLALVLLLIVLAYWVSLW